MMRVNALIVLLFTDLVAATYRFGNYLFAQPVPDMRASLAFDIAYVGKSTRHESAGAGLLAKAICLAIRACLNHRIRGQARSYRFQARRHMRV